MNFTRDFHGDDFVQDYCQYAEDVLPIDQAQYFIEHIYTMFLVIYEYIQRSVEAPKKFQQKQQVNEKEKFLGSAYIEHHNINPVNGDYESNSF